MIVRKKTIKIICQQIRPLKWTRQILRKVQGTKQSQEEIENLYKPKKYLKD